MKYPLLEITVMIEILLARAGEQKGYKGLRNVSEKIESELDLAPKSNKKHEYLHQIFKEKLPAALEKGKTELELKDTYVNEYLDYLGYDDFDSFSQKLRFIKQCLEKLPSFTSGIGFLIPEDQKNYLQGCIENSYYKTQSQQWLISCYKNIATVKEQIRKKGTSFIWFISDAHFNSPVLKELLELNASTPEFIPYWLCQRQSEVRALQLIEEGQILYHDETMSDLYLLTQLSITLFQSNQETIKQEKKESQSIAISGSNTVVLGNMSIKGKYVAERDMYFQKIKKSKKDGE